MQQTEYNIEELYNQHSQRLFFTSRRIVGNTYDAEEIMQDTFLKYYTYPQKKEIREVKKWLSSICIRKSIDMLRARNREMLIIEEYNDTDNNTVSSQTDNSFLFEENNEANILIDKIKTTLDSLPDKYRLILSLHLFEGYDYSEIEQITGIKETYIRSLYMRGKAKLAEILQHKIK